MLVSEHRAVCSQGARQVPSPSFSGRSIRSCHGWSTGCLCSCLDPAGVSYWCVTGSSRRSSQLRGCETRGPATSELGHVNTAASAPINQEMAHEHLLVKLLQKLTGWPAFSTSGRCHGSFDGWPAGYLCRPSWSHLMQLPAQERQSTLLLLSGAVTWGSKAMDLLTLSFPLHSRSGPLHFLVTSASTAAESDNAAD